MSDQHLDYEISAEDYDYLTAPRVDSEPCAWCGGRLIHAELCVSQTPGFLPKITFGKKHKGKAIRDTPSDYLVWALSKTKLLTIDATKAAIEKVRSDKAASPTQIESWERQLREREKEQTQE